jgi:hypothetical protein
MVLTRFLRQPLRTSSFVLLPDCNIAERWVRSVSANVVRVRREY